MREVYRTNQHFLGDFFSENTFGMHAVFIANKESLTYGDIYRDMIFLLKQARDKLFILSKKSEKKAPDNINRLT